MKFLKRTMAIITVLVMISSSCMAASITSATYDNGKINVTTDGYTVQLGDRNDLRAKIGAMRAVRLKLIELGKEDGTINVADDPVHPTYMP